MKKIKLTCPICGTEYEKSKSEYERNIKLGRKSYCSLKCVGYSNIPHLPKDGNPEFLIAANKRDEFSPFRSHLKNARMRKNKQLNLSLEYLKELWEKQKGKCPYTGWNLQNPPTTSSKLEWIPDRASLDRIDSSKGYIKGNVQFVSMIAQFAKNKFTEDQLLEFCKSVSDFRCH